MSKVKTNLEKQYSHDIEQMKEQEQMQGNSYADEEQTGNNIGPKGAGSTLIGDQDSKKGNVQTSHLKDFSTDRQDSSSSPTGNIGIYAGYSTRHFPKNDPSTPDVPLPSPPHSPLTLLTPSGSNHKPNMSSGKRSSSSSSSNQSGPNRWAKRLSLLSIATSGAKSANHSPENESFRTSSSSGNANTSYLRDSRKHATYVGTTETISTGDSAIRTSTYSSNSDDNHDNTRSRVEPADDPSNSLSEVRTIDLTQMRLKDSPRTSTPGAFIANKVQLTPPRTSVTERDLQKVMKHSPSLIINAKDNEERNPSDSQKPLSQYKFNLGNGSSASSSSDNSLVDENLEEHTKSLLVTGSPYNKTPSASHKSLSTEHKSDSTKTSSSSHSISTLKKSPGSFNRQVSQPFEKRPFALSQQMKKRAEQNNNKNYGPRHPSMNGSLLVAGMSNSQNMNPQPSYQNPAINEDKGSNSPTYYDTVMTNTRNNLIGKNSNSSSSYSSRYEDAFEDKYRPQSPSKYSYEESEKHARTIYYGPPACQDSTAIFMVLISILAPPFWILIAFGYMDKPFGRVPLPYKLASAVLAILFFMASIIGIGFGIGYSARH